MATVKRHFVGTQTCLRGALAVLVRKTSDVSEWDKGRIWRAHERNSSACLKECNMDDEVSQSCD